MKRLLFALVPWMAMATGGLAQVRPASVSLTYLGVLTGSAYRLGDECFVTPDLMRQAGWRFTMLSGKAYVQAEGNDFDISTRNIEGVVTIPLRKAIDKLGGVTDWAPDDRLLAMAVIKSARIHNGHVEVESTMKVKPKASFFDSPGRIVIDFEGSRLAKPGDFEIDANSRIGQFQDDVARLVVEADEAPSSYPASFAEPSTHFSFGFDAVAPPPTPQVVKPRQADENPASPEKLDDDGSGGGVLPLPVAVAATGSANGPLSIQLESPEALLLSMKLGAPLAQPPKIARPEPTLIEVTLYGVDVVFAEGFKLDTQSVSEVTTRKVGNATIIDLRTARPVGVEISNTVSEFKIRFMKPDVGNGKLAGKTIVVDPGHGGHDSGAKSPDKSLFEKYLTLDIANNVSEKLAEEGAIVIMTRKSDVFIPLLERADIANRNHADFFISIHINSNSLSDAGTSGGITFFHKENRVGQLLAETIQHEIAPLSGIPSMGAWSDGKIYQTGFSVLRNTTMPAVLIECGFINNHNDRAKLQTAEFREGLALGVVRGLRVFIGDVKTN